MCDLKPIEYNKEIGFIIRRGFIWFTYLQLVCINITKLLSGLLNLRGLNFQEQNHLQRPGDCHFVV